MPRVRDRRYFLKTSARLLGAAAIAGFARPRSGVAQESARSLEVLPLREGLVQLRGANGNAVLLTERDGGLLVDSGAPETRRRALGPGSAHSSEAVGPRHALQYALAPRPDRRQRRAARRHDDRRAREHAAVDEHRYYVEWEDGYKPRPRGAAEQDLLHVRPAAASIGGERVEYGHLREAHTDGDLYVHFPEHNVIVAGGAVGGRRVSGRSTTHGRLDRRHRRGDRQAADLANANTLIVPDVGPVQSARSSRRSSTMLSTVRDRIESSCARAGASGR